jgi:integrase
MMGLWPMARTLSKLNAINLKRLTKPGRHSDGGNLYLVVDKSGAKRWVFLFRDKGRPREMGLGGLTRVPLAAARQKAEECRHALGRGENPLDLRRLATKVPTFGEMVDEYIAVKKDEWRNAKHAAQWETTLTVQAAALGPMKITDITTEDVKAVLTPIWFKTPETASRLRGRIEKVMGAGLVKVKRMNLPARDNPARWKDNLEHELPRPKKLTQGHLRALPFNEVPAFLKKLHMQEGVSPRALEFQILTAARSGETRGALWSEINLDTKVWTVPGGRMKMGKEHRVPLPPKAVKILEEMKQQRVSDYVFPGAKKDRPLSDMSLVQLTRRMKVDAVPHGFRSSFRDWCGECTDFPREVAEQALAHSVGDAVEQAYRRGDALEKRRKLMEAWSLFVNPFSEMAD